MTNLFTVLLSAVLLSHCSQFKTADHPEINSRELDPEPDRAERLRYEALQGLLNSGCRFIDPDTTMLSVIIRDRRSGLGFIGNEKPVNENEYRFYSGNYQQILSLIQHPGDGQYQISIFKVGYAKKDDYGYRKLNVDRFQTGKGIGLGMSKAEVVGRLGSCYAALDSTENYMELYYRIEAPQDTGDSLLARHNLPVYFASYRFRNGGLESFEFGFEYP